MKLLYDISICYLLLHVHFVLPFNISYLFVHVVSATHIWSKNPICWIVCKNRRCWCQYN